MTRQDDTMGHAHEPGHGHAHDLGDAMVEGRREEDHLAGDADALAMARRLDALGAAERGAWSSAAVVRVAAATMPMPRPAPRLALAATEDVPSRVRGSSGTSGRGRWLAMAAMVALAGGVAFIGVRGSGPRGDVGGGSDGGAGAIARGGASDAGRAGADTNEVASDEVVAYLAVAESLDDLWGTGVVDAAALAADLELRAQAGLDVDAWSLDSM
jgi:hypothetical protein